MRPLRVLRIISRMTVGEAAPQVGALLRGLDPDRFEQRLYAGPVEPGEPDYRRLRAADVPVRLLPELRRTARPTDRLRALSALVTAMREFRPDLVHSHDPLSGALARAAALACRVPIRVHSFHDHPLAGRRSPTTPYATGLEWALARTTSALVTVNAQVRDALLAARIGRPDQYTVMPPGASLSPVPDRAEARRRLGLAGTGPVVAVVGQVTAVKRPDRVLTVARAVRRRVPDARFLFCGEGDHLAETVAAAEADNLAVTFLPWRPDVETVYAAADVVLLTSDHEGTPLTVIEAAQAGRPVVATDVGGVAEVVRHERTGLLCDRRDLDGLCRAVLRLLGDAELRGRMGRAAAADTREAFGTPRLVAATRDLYHRLALARGGWAPEYVEPVPTLARCR